VVQDVISAPDWQGGLDKMTAIECDAEGRPTLVETENDIKVRRITSRVRIRYDGPNRLSFTQEKGDMKSVEGVWDSRISATGAHARATGSTRIPAVCWDWSSAGRWRRRRGRSSSTDAPASSSGVSRATDRVSRYAP
jgi:hypothetical protein